MIFLGINVSHGASACLMINGVIKFVYQEERLTNIKNFTGYPKKSIDKIINYLLKENLKVDIAAFSTINLVPFDFMFPKNHFFKIADYMNFYGDEFYSKKLKNKSVNEYLIKLKKDLRNNANLYLPYNKVKKKDYFTNEKKFRKTQEEYLNHQSKKIIKKTIFLDHHSCHANYAYFSIAKKQRLNNNICIITLDSEGDGLNQTVWIPTKDRRNIKKILSSSECDLARIYKMTTLILGMKPDEHEYKVMGMAPYSKSDYSNEVYNHVFKNLLSVKNGKVIHNKRPKNLYEYLKKNLAPYRFDNICGAVQNLVEEVSKEIVIQLHKKYKFTHFAISGGVSMNIKMNKVLADLNFVRKIYVSPTGSDESLSIGACYSLSKDKSKEFKNIYLGQNLLENKNDTLKVLKNIFPKKKYKIYKNANEKIIAKLINNNQIVAIANGQEEFGSRALGNRSIVANPSNFKNVKNINEMIKNRDFWMPFALSILEDKHKKFISNKKNISCPFMTIGFDTIENKIDYIKAGTHPYDQTVRPQLLNKKSNKDYYNIIYEFYKLSGIPALLNTSLNLHGYPISSTLKDVANTFIHSGLKYLYVNNKFLIKKNI